MGNSYRTNIRWNPEYDQDVIRRLQAYSNRNLSRELRRIIREHLKYPEKVHALNDNAKDKMDDNAYVNGYVEMYDKKDKLEDILKNEEEKNEIKKIKTWDFPK